MAESAPATLEQPPPPETTEEVPEQPSSTTELRGRLPVVFATGSPLESAKVLVAEDFTNLQALEPQWISFDKEEASTQERHIGLIQQRLGVIRGSVAGMEAQLEMRVQAERAAAAACVATARLDGSAGETETIGKGLNAFTVMQERVGELHLEFANYIAETLLPRVYALRREVMGDTKTLAKAMKKHSATVQKFREDSIAALAAYYRDADAVARSGFSVTDPWLSEQRYKDCLRLLRRGKVEYRKAMQALYNEYRRVDAHRMQQLQELITAFYVAYRHQLLKLNEETEAARSRASEVSADRDLAEFTRTFHKEKRTDPLKEPGYLSQASKQVVLAGYLAIHHGTVFGSWKRHWVVLTVTGFLHYYQADVQVEKLKHGAPDATVVLRDATVSAETGHKLGELVIVVAVQEKGWLFDSQKTVTLRASSPEDLANWVQAINCVAAAVRQVLPPKPRKEPRRRDPSRTRDGDAAAQGAVGAAEQTGDEHATHEAPGAAGEGEGAEGGGGGGGSPEDAAARAAADTADGGAGGETSGAAAGADGAAPGAAGTGPPTGTVMPVAPAYPATGASTAVPPAGGESATHAGDGVRTAHDGEAPLRSGGAGDTGASAGTAGGVQASVQGSPSAVVEHATGAAPPAAHAHEHEHAAPHGMTPAATGAHAAAETHAGHTAHEAATHDGVSGGSGGAVAVAAGAGGVSITPVPGHVERGPAPSGMTAATADVAHSAPAPAQPAASHIPPAPSGMTAAPTDVAHHAPAPAAPAAAAPASSGTVATADAAHKAPGAAAPAAPPAPLEASPAPVRSPAAEQHTSHVDAPVNVAPGADATHVETRSAGGATDAAEHHGDS